MTIGKVTKNTPKSTARMIHSETGIPDILIQSHYTGHVKTEENPKVSI